MQRKPKEIPLVEITLRKFEKPYEKELTVLLKKFCISLGLLQPGDSRDVIVYILEFLLKKRKERKLVTVDEIRDYLKEKKLRGLTPQNLRRHLKKLEDIYLVDRVGNGVRIKEWMELPELIKEIEEYLVIPIFNRIEEYARRIEDSI
ncbi:MAG TPA: hypothetical protein ENG56_01010 [Candidatus Aenigmarchaeota archaeon]|nr:MAG: hypothetical protein DRN63_04980 [Nanoarchaeota archaeon]HDN90922.1 hypothetical protein [Candidatus Aenigmarchaeota archaeon]